MENERAVAAARAVVEQAAEPWKPGPLEDPRRRVIRDLHELNRRALERAKFALMAAQDAKRAAEMAFRESRARLELIDVELGILERDPHEEGVRG